MPALGDGEKIGAVVGQDFLENVAGEVGLIGHDEEAVEVTASSGTDVQAPVGRGGGDDGQARLLESGRRNKSGDGPGLSPASVRYVHRILRKALGDAVRKGTLTRNPASLADPPKRSTTTKRDGEMRVWTSAQLQTFLESLDGQRLAPAFVLAAHTGMRRGEVAGLRWSDVDLDAKLEDPVEARGLDQVNDSAATL